MTPGLRILVVTNVYPTPTMPGDTPAVRDQVESLRACGLAVDVLRIDRSQGWVGYAKAAWRMFLENFRRSHYDLVHAYYGHSGLIAQFQFRYPVVVTFLGSDLLTRRDGRIGKLAARLADGVIVMTEEMKTVARRPDAHVIPHGINTHIFRPYPKEAARRELGLPLDEKLVLFPWDPARAVKRFDIVKQVIEELQQRDESIRLVIVYDKSHETAAKYMNACDAMILASDHEGAPMAVREALACGLSVVSVDVGDVRQTIGDIEGCYICRQDVSDLAEKLALALSRGARVRATAVHAKMDMGGVAQQIISVYEFVLEKQRRTRNSV